ncbi:MAG: hypothetical protein ACXWQE_08390 [Bdellovibrionales bacterium]
MKRFIFAMLFIASTANALPMAKTNLWLTEAREQTILSSLESTSGQRLTTEQRESLETALDGFNAASETPAMVSDDGNIVTPLFCVGVSAAFYIQGNLSACTDPTGKPYYMFGRAIGFAAGLSGDIYVFLVNRGPKEHIRTNFTTLQFGWTANTSAVVSKTMSVLGVIAPFIGPKLGLYHSMIGDQGGMLVGVKVGKMWENGSYSSINVYETREALVADLKNIENIGMGPDSDVQQRRYNEINK